MAPRPHRARSPFAADSLGKPQLTLAHLIVKTEQILRIFARPLMLGGAFLALSWFGVLPALYPWGHLAVLVIFTALFFQSLGNARAMWRPVSPSAARRRVEEASGLSHRPLDVLDDHPVSLDADQLPVWQQHVAQARAQMEHVRWPKWKLDFADRDPYALRYALLISLVVAALFGWGALGGRLMTAINPALGKLHMTTPTLDAWITPPEYTHLPPIMIATPAGSRHEGDVIDVPEGSVISAHLAEKDGTVPDLKVNDQSMAFDTDDQHDFEASQPITSGKTITIRRGWQSLGSWHIRVVTDQPPKIAFTDQPSVTERKTVSLPFEASDDYGVTSIILRIIPHESLPGASSDPVEISLATPEAKDVKRVSFEDLTAHPWAGLPVGLQLVATDAAGHKTETAPVDFTLPERIFFQPVARALIEERKKLLLTPFDDAARNEAANVMAGIAHEPASYRGDAVVMMALRSGAVRLILDRSQEATASVDDILWQAAVRIEDGTIGVAEQNLRQAQKDLADALDRNASEQDIQQLIDRLHQALAQYLSELSMRMAARPGPIEDLSQLLGTQSNMLTPKDLDRMLDEMRSLSAAGSHDAALAELQHLQQVLENLRTDRPQLSPDQRMALERLKELRSLAHDQQEVLDKTFQSRNGGKGENHKLAEDQNKLLERLRSLMGGMKDAPSSLKEGSDAMKQAGGELQEGAMDGAAGHQNEAMKALKEAEDSMMDNLRQSLMLMQQPGMGANGAGGDPFGRDFGGLMGDDAVKVPDQMEVRHVREILDELQRRAGDMTRPKMERDYIERLLQNF